MRCSRGVLPPLCPLGDHCRVRDAVAGVRVDDELTILLDEAEVFAYNFSTGGYPMSATVEVPRTTMEQLAGQTVTVEYQDIYGKVVEASAMWLIWIP